MTKLVIDTFTEASDTDLDAHTPDTGIGWTEEERTGTRLLEVVGGVGFASATGAENSDRHLYSAQPDPSASSTTEYDVSLTFAQVSGFDDTVFCLLARFTDTDNYYSAGTDAVEVSESFIFKKVGGTVTEIANGDFGLGKPDAGEELIFKVRDSTSRQTYRNEDLDIDVTADDTALTAAGKCGMAGGNIWVATDDIDTPWDIDSFYWDDLAVAGGQPTQHRTQGIPTGSGFRDRPGRWN